MTQSEVQALLPLAISDWAAAGLDPDDLRKLEAVKVQVGDLGTSVLGRGAANAILINQTAAGANKYIGSASEFGLEGAAARCWPLRTPRRPGGSTCWWCSTTSWGTSSASPTTQ